jgi:glycosyltransferase involved in cell wall biosynthesis
MRTGVFAQFGENRWIYSWPHSLKNQSLFKTLGVHRDYNKTLLQCQIYHKAINITAFSFYNHNDFGNLTFAQVLGRIHLKNNMSAPLPNPTSPSPDTFLTRLLETRQRLQALKNWSPVTGEFKESGLGKPFVSVMVITYNHERYIRKALDSILMQECDFPIEINVIDDASTDATQAIAREYNQRFPGVVNCYFNPINVGHIATQLNTIRGFQTLRGRYFALLEGDDYWTDTHKLAKQVAFLEGHTDFVACAHQTMKVFDDNSRPPEHFLPFKAFGRNIAEMYDLVSMAGVFHLSSIVYRNVFRQTPPACLYDKYSCDVTINMLFGIFGKFYCFDEYMSVYRVHDGGVFSGRTYEKHWRFHLHGFRRFALYLGPQYWTMFAQAVRGFTRYVINAPSTEKEVTSLSLNTRILFAAHFAVAAFVCLFSRTGRKAYSMHMGNFFRLPLRQVLLLMLKLIPRIFRIFPETLVRLAFRLECCFPRWQAYRRALRDQTLTKRS